MLTIAPNIFFNSTGFETTIFARRDLYDLMLSKIPPSKIQFNKKIMSIMQNREGVMIRFSDNTHFHGDILIGADGAYSAVCQSLYKQLSDQDLLPASDKEEMPMAYLCMVGTTDPLDPEKYPALADTHTHFSTHLGKTVPQSVRVAHGLDFGEPFGQRHKNVYFDLFFPILETF